MVPLGEAQALQQCGSTRKTVRIIWAPHYSVQQSTTVVVSIIRNQYVSHLIASRRSYHKTQGELINARHEHTRLFYDAPR